MRVAGKRGYRAQAKDKWVSVSYPLEWTMVFQEEDEQAS